MIVADHPHSIEYDFYVFHARIISEFTPNELFFSLDPTELVTEIEYEKPFAPDGGRYYFAESFYVSNPQLEPTLPDDFYVLTVEFSRYVDTGSSIEMIDERVWNLNMHVTPEPTIDSIINFIFDSIDTETLQGEGTGNSADNKLNAFISKIDTAAFLIDAGDPNSIIEACGELQAAYKECDGVSPPPDFVSGEAQEELAGMILDLTEELGCE